MKRLMKRFATLGLAAGLSFGVATSANAAGGDAFFDPTGAANFGAVLSNLDWQPGNSIADGGITAIGNFINGQGSTEFDFYYQATLGTYRDGTGLNLMPDGKELTIVVGLTERVTDVTGAIGSTNGTASFEFLPGNTNFFEVYLGDANSNALAGTGYNDGELVLRADIANVNPTLFTNNDDDTGPLDQTVGDTDGVNNDYPDINSVGGNGSTTMAARITEWDTDVFHFEDVPPLIELALLQNIGVDLPFLSIDPSSAFVDTENAGAIGSAGPGPNTALGPNGDGTGSVGTLNGFNGPDVVFQTDTNQTFKAIPEPTTAVLGLITLGGVGLATRRRRNA